jgi:hypothetical protein
VDEVRLDRRVERVHAALLGQVVPLPGVAAAARRDHVGPLVGPAARDRDQVIAGQALARLELVLVPV